jgi:HlyD family secretion protein
VKSAIILCLLSIMALLVSCSEKQAHDTKGSQLATVEVRDLKLELETIGDLRPSTQVEVKIEIPNGRIKKIHVRTGSEVQKGDLLVELDDSDLRIQKSSAETEIEGTELALEKASLAAKRAKQLVEADLISQAEADNLRLDAEIAANNLTKARKKLQLVEDNISKTKVAAPISGSVIELPVVEGQVVIGGSSAAAAGSVLMRLANLSQMVISVHINQVDVTRIKLGQKVKVSVEGFEDINLSGEIVFVAPVATLKTNIKGFPVEILVSAPDERIRPGMSARVKIPIAEVRGATTVPIEAVFKQKNKRVVYVKDGEKFAKRAVELGVITSDAAEVKSGVKAGEQISLIKMSGAEAE